MIRGGSYGQTNLLRHEYAHRPSQSQEPGASLVEKLVRSLCLPCHGEHCLRTAFRHRPHPKTGEEALLDIMTILPLTDAAARQAANLHAELIVRNQDIGVKDVLIASICLEHEIPLITMNERHFSRVPGLKLARAGDV